MPLTKQKKYEKLGIILTEYVQDLFTVNYKALMIGIRDLNKFKDIPYL